MHLLKDLWIRVLSEAAHDEPNSLLFALHIRDWDMWTMELSFQEEFKLLYSI